MPSGSGRSGYAIVDTPGTRLDASTPRRLDVSTHALRLGAPRHESGPRENAEGPPRPRIPAAVGARTGMWMTGADPAWGSGGVPKPQAQDGTRVALGAARTG